MIAQRALPHKPERHPAHTRPGVENPAPLPRTWRVGSLAGLLAAGVAALAGAAPPLLQFPAACEAGIECVVQNYFDHDPGSAARDYACGSLVYDGHKGTDIRLPDLRWLERGVKVVAAASGRVRAVRDGMSDVSVREIGKAALKGREAGNSVVIEHGDGWETQYAHMRRGSVRVRPGQQVVAGDELGEIGLSGNTEFPHLHFEVRRDGVAVDPFTGPGVHDGCGTGPTPLWSAAALAALPYRPGGLLSSGFAAAAPSTPSIDAGTVPVPGDDPPALVFWAKAFGLRTGDRELLTLTGPDGRLLAERRATLPGNKAKWIAYAGRKRPDGGWSPGLYRGEYRVLRTIGEREEKIVEVRRDLLLR